MIIELNKTEIYQCYYLAKMRTLDAQNKGQKDARGYKADSNPEKELTKQALSFGAEIAAEKALGIPIQARIAGEGKPDGYFMIKDTLISFDVKYSPSCPFMSVPPDHAKNSNMFIYATGCNFTYDVIGGISSKRLIKEANYTDYGNGRSYCYSIKHNNLTPTETILDKIQIK